MNKLFFTAILNLVILSFNGFAQESKTFFQAVEGRWQGTLEYKDYTSNKRVVMNTIITFKSAADGNSAEVFTIYDDFGKIYKSNTKESIDTTAKKFFDDATEFDIESGAAGKAAAGYIEAAVELCAAGSVDAIATAPINKRALFLGGYSFPGRHHGLAPDAGSAGQADESRPARPCAPAG